jgi:hypothetical protein
MKKLIVLTSAMLVSVFLFAYDWDRIGPANIHVNSYDVVLYNIAIEIFCTDNGILIHEGDEWNEYATGGLPALNAVGLDPNNILVLLGNGSYSDGIYKFNLTSHQYQIIEWMPYPNFLQYCENENTYYAGSMDGIWKSTDGLTFTLIDYFSTKECKAFTWYENHFVVATDTEIHCSDDGGETWFPAQTASPIIQDMAFQNDGKLFGIFPDDTYSSGLWSSNDFGETWSVEFYEMYMSSVGFDAEGNIFVGWDNDGIAVWNPVYQKLTSFNDGLPNLNINKITVNPFINCCNIIACTANGAYMLTGYLIGIEENEARQHFSLNNYPNPFKGTTSIYFSVDNTCPVRLSIYNMLGREMSILFDEIAVRGQEYKFELNGSALSEGMYYCRLQSEIEINAIKKMVCIK